MPRPPVPRGFGKARAGALDWARANRRCRFSAPWEAGALPFDVAAAAAGAPSGAGGSDDDAAGKVRRASHLDVPWELT